MNESYSIEAIDKTILSQQKFFWLSEIIRIENYFYQEINQRKTLIVLRAPSSAVLIISFTSIVRAQVLFSWNCKYKPDFNFFSNNRNS